jgi:general secretion pathway protein A
MYYRHFRLTGAPFEASARPEALYLSRAHRESLAALEWGLLHEPSGFTTLTGEVGTGKTTLISSILARNFAQLNAAYVINPKLSFEDILRVVLGQFGVQSTGTKLDHIEALVGFLGSRAPEARLAIIVDEAQDLSDDVLEELRLLSNYGQRLGRYLQLVLVGQPELALRLRRPSLRQFNQRIAARSVLSRLSFAEAQEYVGYRLRAKDGHSEDIFDADALNYLLRHSAGIPRQINVLCHNAMLLAYSSEKPRVDLKVARAAAAEYGESLLGELKVLTIPLDWHKPALAGAALGLFLFAGYVYKDIPRESPRDVPRYALRTDGDTSFAVAQETKAAFKAIAQKVAASLPAARRSSQANNPGNQSPELPAALVAARSPRAAQPLSAVPIVLPSLLPADSADSVQHPLPVPALSNLPKADRKRSIVVKYGDTLANLAVRYFGSQDAITTLIDANPQITDIDKIYPGQKIYIPSKRDPGVSRLAAARVASQPAASYAKDTLRSDGSAELEGSGTTGGNR